MIEYDFLHLPEWIKFKGNFDDKCSLHLSNQANDAGKSGRLKLAIQQHGGTAVVSNARISIQAKSGNFVILIGANDATVEFGMNTSGAFDLRLWRKSTLTIGANTTSNGTRIVCDMSEVVIGEDCMFSDGILIQSADQHGIVDLKTGQIVNNRMRKVLVGDHVWVGRASTLMADISIGNGSIIGTGAIVTKDIPETSIAVGVPAKVVKSGMTWSRSPVALDAMARMLVDQHK